MDNVSRYGRFHRRAAPLRWPQLQRRFRPGRWLSRYGGFLLLVLSVGAIAGHNLWQSGGFAAPAPASALFAVHAVDGDTLRADGQRIRLSGIDAPELAQTCRNAQGQTWSCGAASRRHLAALVAQGGVACTRRGEDRYGRMLATCSAVGVADIGEAMVRDGYAVNYGRYTSAYAGAEREAGAARRGLWQGAFDNPEAWRHARSR